jgi:hypothetical protein
MSEPQAGGVRRQLPPYSADRSRGIWSIRGLAGGQSQRLKRDWLRKRALRNDFFSATFLAAGLTKDLTNFHRD